MIVKPLKTVPKMNIQEGEPASSSTIGRKECWMSIGALVVLFLGLIGLISAVSVYALSGGSIPQFGLVFDAGSMHTELAVYQWTGQYNNMQLMHSCTTRGSDIASYSNRPQEGVATLKACIAEADEKIGSVEYRRTAPIYLGATGGLRLMELKNRTGADQLLSTVSSALNESGYEFSNQTDQCRIISGKEEGVYGWMSVNHHTQQDPDDSDSDPTLGILDLGGASTQISFELDSNAAETTESTDVMTVDLDGRRRNVFAISFLCYGLREAKYRLLAQLTAPSLIIGSTVVSDPCLSKGTVVSVPIADIFDRPCTSSNLFRPITESSEMLSSNVTLVGTGELDQCRERVKSLFNTTVCSSVYNYSHCFDRTKVPQWHGQFRAFAGYHFVFRNLHLSGRPSEAEFLDAADTTCRNNTPLEPSTKINHLCFYGAYVYTFLTYGYGFTNQAWHRLEFVKKINNQDLGWSMGYMLHNARSIPLQMRARLIGLELAILLVLVCFVLVVVSLVPLRRTVVLYRDRRRKNGGDEHFDLA